MSRVAAARGFSSPTFTPCEMETILIFGGTGSLGTKFVELCRSIYHIVIVSRDENKQWNILNDLSNTSSATMPTMILGDIRDAARVSDILLEISPHIILNAAALKHVDRCEYECHEAYQTNCNGVRNILAAIRNHSWPQLHTVLFVSTDKACSPINTYGLTKGLAEKLMIEQSKKYQYSSVRYITVRYGNILNSRGSILDRILQNPTIPLMITHPDMTRFIMTQEDAVRLIVTAIETAKSGDIVIPKLDSMKIIHLLQILASKYNNASIHQGSIRPGEKIHEILWNESEWPRIRMENNYYYITPSWKIPAVVTSILPHEYSSDMSIVSKDKLTQILTQFIRGG